MTDESPLNPTITSTADVPESAPSEQVKPSEALTDPEPAIVPAERPTVSTPDELTTTSPTTPTTKEPTEEPQNALTKKFTEAEWKALKEFRALIPEAFAEAFPDNADAKTSPIKLWGITVNPTQFDDARVSVVLMKFLRARYLNPTEASSMLVSTLRWRDIFKPEATLTEEFPQEIFGELGYVFGKDKDGRPVTYNLYGANKDLKAVFGDIERFLRWRVSLMERGILLLDFETTDQMVQIHDYEGVSLSSRDANSKNAANEATSIFTGHYPEFLHKKFFVNVPGLMTWIFWIFKPLLSAQTVAKMSVVGSGAHTIGKAILPYVDADELPEKYGGHAQGFQSAA